jgi:hypothetical protein
VLNGAKPAVSLPVCRCVLPAAVIYLTMSINCRTGGRAVEVGGLRPLACTDRGFKFVSVVCCHVPVSATCRSLVQRSLTECGVSTCDRETLKMRKPRHTRSFLAMKKKSITSDYFYRSLPCIFFTVLRGVYCE